MQSEKTKTIYEKWKNFIIIAYMLFIIHHII